MKKSMIALTVAGVLSAPLAAQAEVKVYGKVHVNAGTYEETVGGVTVEDNFQFTSYDSRLGVKGEHDLGDGLKAVYLLEFGVNPDNDGSSSTDTTYTDSNGDTVTVTDENDGTAGFSRRNMWVGLKGGFGEFRFGRHDTPLKMAQGKFDQFGDTLGDLKHAGSDDGEHRFDNVLAYLGKSENLGFAIALVPSEGDGVTAGDGVADSISASIAYKEGPLYVALATDSYDDTGAAAGSSNTLTRLVGTYKFGDSQLGLLWQSGVEKVSASSSEEDWIGLSFNTRMSTDYKFKAQYIMTEDNATAKTENTLTAVGIERKFGKKTSGYVQYTNFESDATGSANDEEISSFSLGYVVKF
jgi:predicted porin